MDRILEHAADTLEGQASAAARPTVELVCASCGYGVASRSVPPLCPMCHESDWEPHWRLFDQARRELLPFGDR
jgi:rubrerythrin